MPATAAYPIASRWPSSRSSSTRNPLMSLVLHIRSAGAVKPLQPGCRIGESEGVGAPESSHRHRATERLSRQRCAGSSAATQLDLQSPDRGQLRHSVAPANFAAQPDAGNDRSHWRQWRQSPPHPQRHGLARPIRYRVPGRRLANGTAPARPAAAKTCGPAEFPAPLPPRAAAGKHPCLPMIIGRCPPPGSSRTRRTAADVQVPGPAGPTRRRPPHAQRPNPARDCPAARWPGRANCR
jgi:hypothetical protein